MTGSGPALSVLVARGSRQDPARILETLAALDAQAGAPPFEVIVVDRIQDGISRQMREAYPRVRHVACPGDTTLPHMRAIALEAAAAPWVVVTEDHCVPAPDWLRCIAGLIGATPDAVAIGGCVENGVTDRVLDWATFLCEYVDSTPPLAGRTAVLTGINVAYRKDILDAIPPDRLRAGFWEFTVHPLLTGRGLRTVVSDTPVVRHCKRFSARGFVSQRFAYSRYFGGTRFGTGRWPLRMAAALAVPALPLLIGLRWIRAVRTRPRLARPALKSVPYLAIFSAIAAAGEFVGYVAGPGTSLARLE